MGAFYRTVLPLTGEVLNLGYVSAGYAKKLDSITGPNSDTVAIGCTEDDRLAAAYEIKPALYGGFVVANVHSGFTGLMQVGQSCDTLGLSHDSGMPALLEVMHFRGGGLN